jgi:1-acyl-sn-glycerol-3-phosphate acyltransferase
LDAQPSALDRLVAGFLVGLTRLISGAQARWQGCPPDAKQRVYYANHSSHLDFTVLWASLPPQIRAKTRAVAARDYWDTGAFKMYLAEKVFRSILVDRIGASRGEEAADKFAKARGTVDKIVDGIGTDQSLIIFPEGTRSKDGHMGPFKSGLYHLCQARPDLELIPVYLENLNRILPKGEFMPVPLLSAVTFGAPLRLQPGETKGAFLERAWQALHALRRA